jgi:predicted Zn-ribbon and HTH transcriptional regulator
MDLEAAMYRKELVALLEDHPMTVHEIARLFGVGPRDVVDDLRHIQKSLRHEDVTLHIEPAVCRKCGFVFRGDKIAKPGKCPRCHGTWIREPRISVDTG